MPSATAAGTATSPATSARPCCAACSRSAPAATTSPLELIAPLRERLAPIGGSHAQRDVVSQTLLAAAARGDLRQAGAALLDERRRAKPTTPLSEHWARELGAPSRR